MKTKKPVPFYFLTTNNEEELTFEAAKESLGALKEAGFGGAILFNKPPTGFTPDEYLTEKWFNTLENFIKAAGELGLEIWINDAFDYPPGSVAGKIEEIDKTLWQYRLVKKDGKATPERVDWGYPAFENPKSSDLFIKLCYEEYKKRFGKYFNNGISGFFSDADNRRVHYRESVENPEDLIYFPWAEDFDKTFIEKFGYDITPYLTQIVNREGIPQAADYWQHCGDLYHSWFKQNAKWCKKNNLSYTFHTSDTSPFPLSLTERSSPFSEGRTIALEAVADYCGVDQELLAINGGLPYLPERMYIPKVHYGEYGEIRHPDYFDALGDVRTKQAQSAAFLYGRSGTMCEMFAASGWGATFNLLRGIVAFQAMQGVTFVVPHAVHYRLMGELKFFAPPVFMTSGSLSRGMKEFTGMIEDYVAKASVGKLKAPVAVLDITRELWCEIDNSERFLEVCHELNKMPQGYVIANEEEIAAHKDSFRLVVNAGESIGDEVSGVPVLNVSDISDLDKINEILPCKNIYSGEGKPHYMRRLLPDGSEALLVANIEDGKEITGKVTFEGETFDVCLEIGEIAFFSKDKKCFRKPEKFETVAALGESLSVSWEADNRIPLIMWKDKSGNNTLWSNDDSEISASFTVEDGAEVKKLFIPKVDADKIIKIEGITLSNPKDEKVFDDEYTSYDVSFKTDVNTVTIFKSGALNVFNRIFLTGDFDVCLDNKEPYDTRYLVEYNLQAFAPEECNITLKKRSRILSTMRPASEQGHPFYLGSVTYSAELDFADEKKEYILDIGGATNYAKVFVNGKCIGEGIFEPLRFPFEAGGKTKIEIEVNSTGANFIETWSAPFGLTKGAYIKKPL